MQDGAGWMETTMWLKITNPDRASAVPRLSQIDGETLKITDLDRASVVPTLSD